METAEKAETRRGVTLAGTEVEIIGEGRFGPEWGNRRWYLALFPENFTIRTARMLDEDFSVKPAPAPLPSPST